MDCAAFLQSYTDYADGDLPADLARAADAHVAECESCRRYQTVIGQGVELLRSLPEPRLNEDFAPRLQHRIYHVAEEQTLAVHATSGTPALTVLGMAVLLTAVAWSPALRPGAPVVELEPIVVNEPPATLPYRPVSAMPSRLPARPLPDLDGGLWDDPGLLLYDYSALSQRYRRQNALRRVGSEPER